MTEYVVEYRRNSGDDEWEPIKIPPEDQGDVLEAVEDLNEEFGWTKYRARPVS